MEPAHRQRVRILPRLCRAAWQPAQQKEIDNNYPAIVFINLQQYYISFIFRKIKKGPAVDGSRA